MDKKLETQVEEIEGERAGRVCFLPQRTLLINLTIEVYRAICPLVSFLEKRKQFIERTQLYLNYLNFSDWTAVANHAC
jgi:hypothetical protein